MNNIPIFDCNTNYFDGCKVLFKGFQCIAYSINNMPVIDWEFYRRSGMDDEIDFCPFCGKKAVIRGVNYITIHYHIECSGCQARTADYMMPIDQRKDDIFKCKEWLINRWNNRTMSSDKNMETINKLQNDILIYRGLLKELYTYHIADSKRIAGKLSKVENKSHEDVLNWLCN